MAGYAETLTQLTSELEVTEMQLAELSRRREALMQAIRGLSALIGNQHHHHNHQQSPALEEIINATALEGAIECLLASKTRKPLGAAEIHQTMRPLSDINYQSVYRALARDSARERGRVYKEGDKFGLRMWKGDPVALRR